MGVLEFSSANFPHNFIIKGRGRIGFVISAKAEIQDWKYFS